MQAETNEGLFALSRKHLLPGDIIIITDTRKKTNSFNALARNTQKTQVFFTQGHSEAVHAQIIARDDNGDLKIVEVSDDGVLLTDIQDEYKYNMFVYRCSHRTLAERAGIEAYKCYKERRQVKPSDDDTEEDSSKDAKHAKPIVYSDGKLVHAITFSKLIMPYHFQSKDFTTKQICSKFVIECYQVAQNRLIAEAPKLKKQIKGLFRLEKTSSVKSLEHHVSKNKIFTQHIIPKKPKDIYVNLIGDILLSAIVKQTGNPKTAAGAQKAFEIFTQLTNYVTTSAAIDKTELNQNFDMALAILCAVLAHLPDSSEVASKGYDLGFEMDMLGDSRIMALAEKLRSESNIALEASVTIEHNF